MKRRILSIIMVLVMLMSMVYINTTIVYAGDQAEVNGTVYWSHQTAWKAAVDSGGTFKLLGDWRPSSKDFGSEAVGDEEDYFTNGAIRVPKGKSVTIDLNGHNISRNLYYASNDDVSNGEVIYLEKDASLTIKDTSAAGNGRIEDGNSSNGAGGIHAKPGSRIYMYGGEISYCRSTSWTCCGGAVYLDSGAKMYMYGGKMRYNKAEASNFLGGGAVKAGADARFYMYGGEISYNHAKYGGGAAYGNRIDGDTRLEFYGGVICNNTCDTHSKEKAHTIYAGNVVLGGVEIKNNTADYAVEIDGKATLTGGSVHDNSGAGIALDIYESCSDYIGDIKVYNNPSANIYLRDYYEPEKLTFGAFNNDTQNGIYLNDDDLDKSVGTADYGIYAKHFFSDREDCRVVNAADGKLYMRKISEVGADSFITDVTSVTSGGSAVTYDAAVKKSNRTVTIHVPKHTNAEKLAVTFSTTGTASGVTAGSSPTNGSEQNFTSPVTYTLLNSDGRTEQNWSVEVIRDRDIEECYLNVTSGTGSGKYKIGNEVSVSADEIENKRFAYWTAEGISLTESQKISQTITFTMPSNDVTLTANYEGLANTVDITIDEPCGGKPLDSNATVSLSDGTTGELPVSWSPEATTAAFNTTYNAVITITSQYGFSSAVKVNLNGEEITPLKPDSKTLVVTKAFATAKAKLLSIPEAELTGVANGTPLADIALPSEINIKTEDGLASTAEVAWNKDNVTDYYPEQAEEQTFTVYGTITLPDNIEQNGVALNAAIKVTVSEKERAAAPVANLVNGATYESEQTLTLSSATEGVDIYYTTDGSEPATDGTKYDAPITLTGEVGKTVVHNIKAIAVPSDAQLQSSAVSAFTFNIEIPLPTYEVKVVDAYGKTAGLGSGTYHEGDSVTVQTIAMASSYVFKGWTSTGMELTDKQTSSPTFTFTMPANDVTLTPAFFNGITKVELDITAPQKGVGLDKKAGYKLYNAVSETAAASGEDALTVSWTPVHSTAKSNTEYYAAVTLKPNYAGEIVFADGVEAAVNGASNTTCNKNDDGSVTIYAAFPNTGNAKLLSIDSEFDDIYVANKAYDEISIMDILPKTVKITTDDEDICSADVEWTDFDGFTGYYEFSGYESASIQGYTFSGNAILPDGVYVDSEDYTVSVAVYIQNNDECVAPPVPSLTPGVYTENQTLTLAVDDANVKEIRYTTDGTEPNASNGTVYTEAIPLNGTPGNSKTITVKAVSISSNSSYYNSEGQTFKYTINIPAQKETVTIINGTGSGEYNSGESINIVAQPESGMAFKKWMAEAVTYTTEEKEVTETILDENGNSKEVTTTQTVTTRNARTVDGCFDNALRSVTTLTVPALNDGEILEVTAECAEAITAVSFRVAIPAAGEALPTAITSGTSGISIVADSFTITPTDSNAKFNTRYTVSTGFTVADGYTLGETPSFSINGVSVQPTANDDGSYTVSYAFTTEDSITVGGVSAKATDGITVESYDGSVFAVVIDTEMFGGASDNSLYIQDIKVAFKKSGETTYTASSESLSEYTYLDEDERYAVFPVAIDGEISADLAVRGMLETKPSHDSEGTSVYYISEDVFDVKSTATAE